MSEDKIPSLRESVARLRLPQSESNSVDRVATWFAIVAGCTGLLFLASVSILMLALAYKVILE